MTILQLEAMLDFYRRNRNVMLLLLLAVLACSALFGVVHAWGGLATMVILSFWLGYWLVHTQRQIASTRRAIADRIAVRDVRIYVSGIISRDVQ